MKTRMLEDHPTHYVMQDARGSFRVHKAGLSDATHAKIQALAEGGKVQDFGTKMGTASEQAEQDNAAFVQKRWDQKREDAKASAQKANIAFAQKRVQTFADGGMTLDDLNTTTPAQVADALAGAGGYGMPPPQVPQAAPDGGVLDVAPQSLSPHQAAVDSVKQNLDTAYRAGTHSAAPVLKSLSLASDTPAKAPPRPNPDDQPAPRPAAARPAAPAGPLPGVSDVEQATRDQQAAVRAEGEAKAEQARQSAAALGEGDKVLKQHELEQKAVAAQANARAQELMRKHEAATQAILNEDTTVDPGRFWASRSTPAKISGIIGLALGALGAGPDGVNKAATMLTQAVDRDIDAQKSEHALRLQKGQKAIDAAQSAYAMNHQLFEDQTAADAATHATAWAQVENRLKQIAAAGGGPQAQAIAAQLSAEAQAKMGKFRSDAANIAFDNTTQRITANANAEKAARAGAAKPGKNSEQVSGVISAVNDLEDEFKNNPLSPRIGRMRDAIKAEAAKLQGRASPQVLELIDNLIPGTNGFGPIDSSYGPGSAYQRAESYLAPGVAAKKFDVLRNMLTTQANAPRAPEGEE